MRQNIPLNWSKYLDGHVPRYTSYPTAVEFGTSVDGPLYERWLARLPAGTPLSIYIHVPFCHELCLFCGCHTTVARRYAPVAAYVDLLEREIGLVARIIGRHEVNHLHWGGGTPTILTATDFLRLTASLRAHIAAGPIGQTAVEIDPRSLTPDYVSVLRDADVTRVSLGVQDFDDRVQRSVRRLQSIEQTARAVDWLRTAGMTSINLDLMYGLPYQTTASVAANTQLALTLHPDRIALFGYAHVPWIKRHQRLIPKQALPTSTERFVQNTIAADVIVAAGYQRIGLDHFARPHDPLAQQLRKGKLHRNFQGYTTDDAPILIGFGASAIGSLPEGYVQNATRVVDYREKILAGNLAAIRGRALTNEDRLRATIIERLMCELRVDLAEICGAHGVDANHFAAEFRKLNDLAEDGIIERVHDKISVPEAARPLVRTVCAVFDVFLANNGARFSQAS
jgi:oxygen-independent coproporphyrinogen III oxidase